MSAKTFLHFSIIYIIWGVTFIWMKMATDSLSSFFVIGIENLIASLILIAFNFKRDILSFLRENFYEIFTQSLFLLVFGVGFIIISIPHLPAGFSACVMASIPLWVYIFNGLGKTKETNVKQLFAIILGFIGLVLLSIDKVQQFPESLLPVLGLIVASLSWSWGLHRLSYLKIASEPYLSTSGQTLIASFIYLNLAFYQSDYTLPDPSMKSLISVVLLATLGSGLAFSSFNWLLRNVNAVMVSTYAYINPIVSLLCAYFFLNELISINQLVYIFFILISVALIIHLREVKA